MPWAGLVWDYVALSIGNRAGVTTTTHPVRSSEAAMLVAEASGANDLPHGMTRFFPAFAKTRTQATAPSPAPLGLGLRVRKPSGPLCRLRCVNFFGGRRIEADVGPADGEAESSWILRPRWRRSCRSVSSFPPGGASSALILLQTDHAVWCDLSVFRGEFNRFVDLLVVVFMRRK